jgi:hypothetical protein
MPTSDRDIEAGMAVIKAAVDKVWSELDAQSAGPHFCTAEPQTCACPICEAQRDNPGPPLDATIIPFRRRGASHRPSPRPIERR